MIEVVVVVVYLSIQLIACCESVTNSSTDIWRTIPVLYEVNYMQKDNKHKHDEQQSLATALLTTTYYWNLSWYVY